MAGNLVEVSSGPLTGSFETNASVSMLVLEPEVASSGVTTLLPPAGGDSANPPPFYPSCSESTWHLSGATGEEPHGDPAETTSQTEASELSEGDDLKV